MRWIYLSPHFDDAALSCGGLIYEQAAIGEAVEVWTVCAGYPPRGHPLTEFAEGKHAEWRTGARSTVRVRRAEDRAACRRLGAVLRWWSLPDCIYRRLPDGSPLITCNDALWLPVHPGELGLALRLRGWLRRSLHPDDRLVVPLTLGNHVDHRLARFAAEGLRRPLYYYADYPYVAREGVRYPSGGGLYRLEISPEGLEAWQEAVGAYVSQVDDLFGSREAMYAHLHAYWQRGGGAALWQS